MITQINYILRSVVGGETYLFEYYDKNEIGEVVSAFYFEDYPEKLLHLQGSGLFPVEVLAMDGGKVCTTYRFQLDDCAFDHFFAKGWKAGCDPYTLDEFKKDIHFREVKQPQAVSHDVSCYWFYMWNKWTEEECKVVFEDYHHFWNKWCECYDRMGGPRGAAEIFYASLTDHNRDSIVARAIEVYDREF